MGAVVAALGFAIPTFAATSATTNLSVTPPSGANTEEFREGPGADRRPGIFGTVTAISGNTITVTQKTFTRPGANTSSANAPTPIVYSVDASNATITKNNATASLSAIAVGDTIMVQGTVSGTNVTATTIRDGIPARGQRPFGAANGQNQKATTPIIQGNGEPIVGGSVTAISGNTLTITNKSNVTYTVDATNATVQKGNAKSDISGIAVNDNVVVQGTVNGTSVVASSVIDSGATPAANGSGSGSAAHGGVFGFFSGIGGFFAHLFGF